MEGDWIMGTKTQSIEETRSSSVQCSDSQGQIYIFYTLYYINKQKTGAPGRVQMNNNEEMEVPVALT